MYIQTFILCMYVHTYFIYVLMTMLQWPHRLVLPTQGLSVPTSNIDTKLIWHFGGGGGQFSSAVFKILLPARIKILNPAYNGEREFFCELCTIWGACHPPSPPPLRWAAHTRFTRLEAAARRVPKQANVAKIGKECQFDWTAYRFPIAKMLLISSHAM
jgi:hypothetical protein